jgi:hypothetical protein
MLLKEISENVVERGPLLLLVKFPIVSYGLRFSYNNVAKAKVILLVVEIVVERGIQDIQIFGDSQLVIN